MASDRSRHGRAEKKRVNRRRLAQDARARQTQRSQALAAAPGRSTASRRRKHAAAFLCWTVAAGLGVIDLLLYLNVVDWMSIAVANVAVGIPAVLLALVGAMVYGT